MTTDNRIPNRLADEKSPYLLQHASNPVDWFPWGEEAFKLAEASDKLVFLSIGYSSCHWCHVMREESFEDEAVAKILNDSYISIKVDREERPDVDHVYMSFCQAMTGQGGWPLNLILTAEGKPLFAATYIPKNPRGGQMGIKELLLRITELWREDSDKMIASADYAVTAVRETLNERNPGELDQRIFEKCFLELESVSDPQYGGFYKAPKFPLPHHLLYLLRYWRKERNPDALFVVEKALMGMYKGGIFDHLGYGFSRYATDEKWLVPHFEKMLYDNALLIEVYAEAYAATGSSLYREVSEKTIEYILREMTSPEGAFYSAEDADSEGVEGKYYLFDKEEILKVLGEKDGSWFATLYGVTETGDFEGKNILNLLEVDLNDLPTRDAKERRDDLRRQLLAYRETRVKPGRDEKILSSWNGLMISALAYAGRVFHEPLYIEKAKAALAFILENMMDAEGNLYASFKEGRGREKGFLDSYAYLVHGVLELQEATLDNDYLRLAEKLTKKLMEEFHDEVAGDFRLSGRSHDRLVLEAKDVYDSAMPSGNSVAAVNLSRLWSLTGKNRYQETLEKMFRGLSGRIQNEPKGFTYLLTAYMTLVEGPREVVLTGNLGDKPITEMREYLSKLYLPDFTFCLQSPEDKANQEDLFTLWREMEHGEPTAYVCENFTCHLGVKDLEELKELLED